MPHVVEIAEFHLEGSGSTHTLFWAPDPLTIETLLFLLLLLFVLLLTPPLPASEQASVPASRIIRSEKVIESTIRSSEQERFQPPVIPASVFQR